MFGIGSTELLVILVVALIVLGPKSLAGVSRSLGKAMGEFRRVSTDFQRTLNAEAAEEELKEQRLKREAQAAARSARQNAAQEAPGFASRADPAKPAENASENTDDAARNFDEQMSRIGKWERPDPNAEFTPPPGSPLAEAMEKARQQAENHPKMDAATTRAGDKETAHANSSRNENPHA